jgi:hypothetical protein
MGGETVSSEGHSGGVTISAGMAERQGGGRKINECYSETKENQSWGMLLGDKQKGHLAPEVRAANEMTCGYVWDKLYSPISVTCSKW